jgi:trehalose-6-phosphate synthase
MQKNLDFSAHANLLRGPLNRETDSKSSELIYQEIISEVQELKEELIELQQLKEEILKLREETSRNRQMILSMGRRRESCGDEIKMRVAAMTQLINDYGGAMTTSSIKRIMGLSKDEFYRALRLAREHNLLEVDTNPKDRRGFILRVK